MLEEIVKSLEKAVVSDIRVYDMKSNTPFYDYTIICSVNTARQGAADVDYLRDDAEKLIEDFMVFANECVATHIYWQNLPFVYRIHDKPKTEKIMNFSRLIKLPSLDRLL